MRTLRRARAVRAGTVAALVLAGCSSTPVRLPAEPTARAGAPSSTASAPSTAGPAKRGGGYYLDDGPGDHPPPDLDLLPDAVPRVDKLASGANRPYNVFGVDYVPDLSGAPFRQRGVGSWYGRKFHGQRTSSGEIYDMYAMTAAHPTLPIPCYALVTNVSNGRSAIVRVNDRGPFLHNRVMDLSYAAALKLGYLSSGSDLIEVEMLMPADIVAGRIPVTTNSIAVAAAAAARSMPPVAGAPATLALVAPPAVQPAPQPVAMPTATIAAIADAPRRDMVPLAAAPGASPPSTSPALPDAASLAATYTARGIPPDLIPDPQPPATLPETTTSAGWFLQLGAFRARAGAESFAALVSKEIDPSVAAKLHVADVGGLYRVRLGPYLRRSDADVAATSLKTAIAQPIVVAPEPAAR